MVFFSFEANMINSENILGILHSYGLTLIGKTLQMAYDQKGFQYDLPIFVLNDPSKYQIQDMSKEVISDQTINVNP